MPDTIKTQIQQFKGDLCAFKVGVVQWKVCVCVHQYLPCLSAA